MSFDVGDRRSITVPITEKMVSLFAELSGDYNPIHMDEDYAKTTRFGRRIAHGMISGALISRALAMDLGGEGIYLGQELKFIHPVFIGDEVTVELHVLSIREGKGIAKVETLVKNQRGETCVKGEAIIMKGEFIK